MPSVFVAPTAAVLPLPSDLVLKLATGDCANETAGDQG